MAKGKATPGSKGYTRNVSSPPPSRGRRNDGTRGGQSRTGTLGETSKARAGRAAGSDVDDVSNAGLRRTAVPKTTVVNADRSDDPKVIGAKPIK